MNNDIRVQVYRNLRKGCFSVRDKATRKVIGHVQEISLKDCTMHASLSGISRIRSKRRKAVVAWIEGTTFTPQDQQALSAKQHGIFFNPYQNDTWVDHHGYPIARANVVQLVMAGPSAWVWANA
jgi:hypothetical protein